MAAGAGAGAARVVSVAGHGRRLDRLERRRRAARGDGWLEAVYRLDQEQKAALAIVDFVRALVGTDESETMTLALPAGERATESVPRPPSPLRGKRPSEDLVSRPDRNAVLTWDELMRLGWQVETPPTEPD